jgi:hypothetical protein
MLREMTFPQLVKCHSYVNLSYVSMVYLFAVFFFCDMHTHIYTCIYFTQRKPKFEASLLDYML